MVVASPVVGSQYSVDVGRVKYALHEVVFGGAMGTLAIFTDPPLQSLMLNEALTVTVVQAPSGQYPIVSVG